MKSLQKKLAVGFGLGFAVFVALILYADIQEVTHLLQDFKWQLLPAVVGLTLVNYLLRGLRFQYYLRRLGVTNISFWVSLRVFIGGFALTLTPGKAGELIRVVWLKKLVGADPVRVAPSTIVDRIVDGLAMAILALFGVMVFPQYRWVVFIILGVIVGGVILSQIRPLALWLLNQGERLPLLSRFAQPIRTLYENTYELLRPKPLLVGVGIGLVSWSAEGLAFYLVLRGLNIPDSFNLVLLANFTLALSSILGGVSSLPGGLGAAEATMTGMLQVMMGLAENVAATATILIRFFTLWFGVALGLLTVAIWRDMLFNGALAEEMPLTPRPAVAQPESEPAL
jgi:uncharacterized protein (TIRG00374 family)